MLHPLPMVNVSPQVFIPNQIYSVDDKHTVITNSDASKYGYADSFLVPEGWKLINVLEWFDTTPNAKTIYAVWDNPRLIWVTEDGIIGHKAMTIHKI